MAELLTQLQDQVDALARRLCECVGILQRDAPPVTVSDEPLIAGAGAAGAAAGGGAQTDIAATVKQMAADVMAEFATTDRLLAMLPSPSSGDGDGMLLPVGREAADAAAAAFRAEVAGLQAQDAAASAALAAAAEEGEALLVQLQGLYAALATATLVAPRATPRAPAATSTAVKP